MEDSSRIGRLEFTLFTIHVQLIIAHATARDLLNLMLHRDFERLGCF